MYKISHEQTERILYMKIVYFISLMISTTLLTAPAVAKNDKEKHNQLPPGLQKKAAKGKPLPPGWQKKLAKGEILDQEIINHSEIITPVDSRGLVTIRIEGKLVKLYQATREVAEILKK